MYSLRLGALHNCFTLALEAQTCGTMPARQDGRQASLPQLAKLAGEQSPPRFPSMAGGEQVEVLALQLWSPSLPCLPLGSLLALAPGRMGIQQLPELFLPCCLPPASGAGTLAVLLFLQYLIRAQVSPSSYASLRANCNYSKGFPTAITIYTRY